MPRVIYWEKCLKMRQQIFKSQHRRFTYLRVLLNLLDIFKFTAECITEMKFVRIEYPVKVSPLRQYTKYLCGFRISNIYCIYTAIACQYFNFYAYGSFIKLKLPVLAVKRRSVISRKTLPIQWNFWYFVFIKKKIKTPIPRIIKKGDFV